MFRDTIPEEREEQYEPLIALLRSGLHEPVVLSSSEEAEIVERVRGQLVGTDLSRPRADSNLGSNSETDGLKRVPTTKGADAVHRYPDAINRSLLRVVNSLVAVLVVGILIGTAIFLFRPAFRQSISRPPIASTGPSASTEVDGLRAAIHLVTPGPYFLSELVAVDVSLTNSTHTPFRIAGSSKPDMSCLSSVLNVQIIVQVSGGTAPSYTLPRLDVGCLQPLYITTIAPGRTLAMRYYVPVTKSGEVTIMMGGMVGVPQTGPLAGHWPSLYVNVNPQIPANRAISLHEEGIQVIVEAPAAARTHLLYREMISCDGYLGMGEGIADWSSLATTKLSQPACPTAHKHWVYIVGAPGYAVAAGKRDS